ncbi:MAG TPA: hypothetical protein VGE97_00420 [Nitrososphaera sp.]|jgi:hypothetical protein
MKTAYVSLSIFAIVLVLMSGVPFMSGGGSNAYARYARNTQTQTNINTCSNGTNCAITSPQTQGEGSVSSPTNVQISKFNEEGRNNGGGVGSTQPFGAVKVSIDKCSIDVLPSRDCPSTLRFTITVTGNSSLPQPYIFDLGNHESATLPLPEGPYRIKVGTPPGFSFFGGNYFGDCHGIFVSSEPEDGKGNVVAGQTQICNIRLLLLP